MKLTDTSIGRPVFAVMLIGGIVVFGLLAIPRLGVDLFPRVEFPLVTVTSVLEGASPETVEREVSQVLEESINTIEGISILRSQSSDSLSLMFIEFELDYDVHEKAQEVRDMVALARGDLPRDLEPPVVARVDPDATPILAVMVAGPHDIRELSEFADKKIKPRLERVAGVGNVTLVGDRRREIRIWVDPIRLSGYSLAVDDVVAAIQREHVEFPGGRIETAQREYVVKTKGKLTSAERFGDIVVFERAGRVIHLRDVAAVEDGMAEERTISRLNGRRGVALLIRRQSGENTVAVAHAVKGALAEIRSGLPPGYEMIEAMDTSRFVETAIHDVAVDLAWGALLAALVVLLFLRSVRATVITAIAIPSSLLGTFGFFYVFGFTLNTMTLMALSLSVGLLIDDAIVVLENSHRHLGLGGSPAEAVSRATGEIGLAVIATTLCICAVFVPIAFLSGVVGRFFREFGLVASCAVGISALVSFTLTAMMCARYLRREDDPGRAFRVLEAGYNAFEGQYRRLLNWGLRHRVTVLALAVAAVLGGIAIARTIPADFLVEQDRSEFNVWIKLPLGTTVPQAQAIVARLEEDLRRHPEIRQVFSTIGGDVQKRVNEATLYVQLTHKSTRRVGQMEIMTDLRRRIAELRLPLEEFAVQEVPMFTMPGARHSQLIYAIRGPDIDRLQSFAQSLTARMRQSGGYADIHLSYESGKPEISLEIARDRAADLGVPAAQIGRTIAAMLTGFKAATFEERGERYDVRVQVRPEYRDDPGKLDLLRVRAPGGALVPLRNLVAPRIGSGPLQIDRDNRTHAITLYANLEEKAASTADEEVVRLAEELGIQGEYEVQPIGPSMRLRETKAAIRFAFVVALIAIYMILASQYNSFVHPLTIMVSAPLSFIGAFAAVAITGCSLDVMAQISFLTLMGIVMKNGVLLVDYTNTLRSRGLPLYEAVLQAGPTRMRPVLMTAVSTIFGMLPVALSRGDGSEMRSPMAIIAIGGLITSTFLTLLVVPVVYTLVDNLAAAALRLLGERKKEKGTALAAPHQKSET